MKIMIVEDDIESRNFLVKFLQSKRYEVIEAENGKKALEILKSNEVDIVLMDISMPIMNGLETTKRIRDLGYPVVVIMLTAYKDLDMMKKSAFAGADDYITKPIDLSELYAKILLAEKYLPFHKFRHSLIVSLFSEKELSQKTIEELINKNKDFTMEILNIMYKVSEYRDDETYEHTLRVGWLSGKLAEKLGLDELEVSEIRLSSPLHDIGKIGIPDSILLKPAKLFPYEYEIMKKHTLIGYEILNKSSSSILKKGAEIALTHHERWNGSGYPKGLSGKEIPISGAIVAVADSIDAMASKRPYKPERPIEEVLEEIKALSGKFYNPDVVNALFEIREEVVKKY
uniref:Response regulator n=1 Tax=Dictyoglomus thermophilum TaxID=14 RepID=A0A7C3RM75_DICTH